MSPFHPIDKIKPLQTEKSTLLRSVREVRGWGKPLHPKLERLKGKYRESQLPGAEILELKAVQNLCWGGNLKCNWQIAWGSVWTNRRGKNSGGTQLLGACHTSSSFVSPGAQAIFTVNNNLEKKSPVLLAGGGEKESFWNAPECSAF